MKNNGINSFLAKHLCLSPIPVEKLLSVQPQRFSNFLKILEVCSDKFRHSEISHRNLWIISEIIYCLKIKLGQYWKQIKGKSLPMSLEFDVLLENKYSTMFITDLL